MKYLSLEGLTTLVSKMKAMVNTSVIEESNNIKTLIGGTTLYEGTTVTSGSITLSEDISNFKRLKFFHTNGTLLGEIMPNEQTQNAYLSYILADTTARINIYGLQITLSGQSVTININNRKVIKTDTVVTETSNVGIAKIVGYNY